MLSCICQGKIAYNKKDTFDWWNQMLSLCGVHLKSLSCEVRCFYYLNSKVITIKNNSRIIINRDNSLFVINLTPFFNS